MSIEKEQKEQKRSLWDYLGEVFHEELEIANKKNNDEEKDDEY